ncbi:MAG: hypothetical protein UGF89_06490 [Acutalibacteraceae bacterium]|nr:hypothetical protein [Acutalibacteraceae bacterium]
MNNKYHFMKIMCVILVVISASVLIVLNGCSNENITSEKTEQTNQSEQTTVSSTDTPTEVKVGMEEVYKDGNFTYWRDLTTDVMYLEEDGYLERTLTVMLSPYGDGKPLLYSTWCNIQSYEDKGDK